MGDVVLMGELILLAKDYSGPVNTLLLSGILFFIRSLRADVKDIRDNHLPHLDRRLSNLEGRFEEHSDAN